MEKPQPSFSDLFLVFIWVVLTIITVLIPPLNQSILRIICALPTILFIPGYVLIAALFPEKEDLEGLERIALSFGLSITVVPLFGLALNFTPWGIRLEPILISIVVFIVAMTTIATYRRSVVSPQERFAIPFRQLMIKTKEGIFPAYSSRADTILSLILLMVIITAIGTTIYVIIVPKEGEHFTEFYILGEGGKAADYPRNLSIGDSQTIIVGIGNHEFREVTYIIEMHAMNMTFDSLTNILSVNAMEELNRIEVTVPHNTTFEQPWTFSVAKPGFNRLQFLLFNETVPGQEVKGVDRINASYRDLHLWVNIIPL